MTKLSIIVTAYNIENYIRQSLDRVVSQSLRDIEIIVVDDGSSDQTPQIIQDYADRDARIRPILFKDNTIGGVATAANAGLEVAKGDYVGFADGDDLCDPNMFETLYNAAIEHASDLVLCRYEMLDDRSGAVDLPADDRLWRAYAKTISFDLDEAARRELLRFNAVPWRKIYKRELVERIGLRFPVGDYFFEDNPFHWAAILGSARVAMVPEVLCQYRVSRGGQTINTADARLVKIFCHHENILGWLRHFGVEHRYRKDLLHWTAKQLSWVSHRAVGEVQRNVFDRMVPIVSQYDPATIDEYGAEFGQGRSYQMIKAVREGHWDRYEKFANFPSLTAPEGADGRMGAWGSLMRYGVLHVRYVGLLTTGQLAMRYLSRKLPMGRK